MKKNLLPFLRYRIFPVFFIGRPGIRTLCEQELAATEIRASYAYASYRNYEVLIKISAKFD